MFRHAPNIYVLGTVYTASLKCPHIRGSCRNQRTRDWGSPGLNDVLDHWLNAGAAYLMIEGGWPLDPPASSSEAWSTILGAASSQTRRPSETRSNAGARPKSGRYISVGKRGRWLPGSRIFRVRPGGPPARALVRHFAILRRVRAGTHGVGDGAVNPVTAQGRAGVPSIELAPMAAQRFRLDVSAAEAITLPGGHAAWSTLNMPAGVP